MTTSRDIADYYFEHHYDTAVEAIAAHKKEGPKIDGRCGMSLTDDYVNYPHRRYGIDNDRYDWSILPRRDPVECPAGPRWRFGWCRSWNTFRWIHRRRPYCAGRFDHTLSRPADL